VRSVSRRYDFHICSPCAAPPVPHLGARADRLKAGGLNLVMDSHCGKRGQHPTPCARPTGQASLAARLDVPTRGAKDYVLGSSVRRPRGHLRRHLDAHGGLSRDYRKALGAQALNRRPPGAKRWQSAWQIDAGGRPCWARTSDQRIMHTTSAFAARFRFVVWTLSCLSAFPSSLYTFSSRSFARRWRGGNSSAVASTEFEKFYAKAE